MYMGPLFLNLVYPLPKQNANNDQKMKPTLIEELNNKIQAHKSTMQEEKKLI
jgi:hypothetical protein